MFLFFINIKINVIKFDVLNYDIYKLEMIYVNVKIKNNCLKKIDEIILMIIIFIN